MNSLILLFKIYQRDFLEISVSTGLIHADALALAGDGTPVVTSHRERKNVSANVKRMLSMTVIVTAIFPSLIVISDGTPLCHIIIPNYEKHALRVSQVIATVAKVSCKHELWLVVCVNKKAQNELDLTSSSALRLSVWLVQ